MSSIIHGRNPLWSPEHTGRKPDFNDMGCFTLADESICPINEGLVAWWLMNEGAGGVVDQCKKRLSSSSGGTWGKSNGNIALRFDDAGFNSGLNDVLGTDYSVVVLCTVDSGNSNGCFFSAGQGNGNPWHINIKIATYYCYFETYDGTNVRSAISNPYYIDVPNRPYHLVGVRSGNNLSIYLDNRLGTSSSSAIGAISGTSTYRFGQDSWASTKLIGNIIYAAVYARALIPTEISQLHTSPYGTPSQPRLIYAAPKSYFVPMAGEAPPPPTQHNFMMMGIGA
jgi:hypothetical protein